jgi:hypothetical protein
MLLRCSVCKGQFDVDPDLRKPTVFCSHCGAQLQTVKPGRRRAQNNSAAVGALTTEELPGLTQETAPEPTLGGFVEEFEAPPAPLEQGPAPIQPVASSGGFSDPFSNAPVQNSAGGFPSAPYSAPASNRGRPPMRRKKDNGMMVVMIIVGAFVVIIGVVVAAMMMSGEDPKPTKEKPQVVPDVGELFPEKKGK